MAEKYTIGLPLFEKPEGIPELYKDAGVYCPICEKYFPMSLYLLTDIPDPKSRWFQNMVTHYRNNHLKGWKRLGGKGGVFHRRQKANNYHQEKLRTNEKCKRQILRQCNKFMIAHGMDLETLQGLIYNSEYTMQTANLILVKMQEDNTEETYESN